MICILLFLLPLFLLPGWLWGDSGLLDGPQASLRINPPHASHSLLLLYLDPGLSLPPFSNEEDSLSRFLQQGSLVSDWLVLLVPNIISV